MKGAILPDHMPVNKYQLLVLGMPPLTFTEISGIEDELQTVDLPDRTVASGGNRTSVEFTGKLPAHHMGEQGAMEAWYMQAQDPVSPDYKKTATLVLQSNSGLVVKSYSLMGVFPSKRATPDLEMAAEGEAAMIEWTFKADDVMPG